jgi:hypothetical protein
MKKKILILCAVLMALASVSVSAQQSIKSGGGEVTVTRSGEVRLKPRSDKGVTTQGLLNTCLDAESTDAYVCSLAPALMSYQTGQIIHFKANTANTTAATLNINALGAKTIKKVAGGITTDLATNDIRSGQYVAVQYDGTNFQMLSAIGNADVGGTVTSVSGTANQVSVATGTTTPVISLPAAITAPGTLTVTTSLTVANGTAITRLAYYTATLSPAEVAANTCAEQLFTVTGVAATDVVFGNKPTAQAGLGLGGMRASGSNQVGINFCNTTGSPITPTASQAYVFGVLR